MQTFDEQHEQISKEAKRFEGMVKSQAEHFFDVNQIAELIDYYLNHGKLRLAQKAISIGKRQHPDSAEIKFKEAQFYAWKGHLKKAINITEQILPLEPENDEIHLFRGEIFSEQGEHQNAIKSFETAFPHLEKEDQNYLAIDIAAEYQNLENYKAAQHYLELALNGNADNDWSYLEYIFVMQVSNQLDKGIAFISALIDKNPYNHLAWYYQGIAYQFLELYEKAIDSFNFVISINEEFSDAYIQKAEALMNMNEFKQAIPELKKAYGIKKDRFHIRLLLSECYEASQMYDEAIEHYLAIIKTFPKSVDAHIGLAFCYNIQHEYTKAIGHVKKALAIEPDNISFLITKAKILTDAGLETQAEKIHDDLLNKYPDDPEVCIGASGFKYATNNLEEAIFILLQAFSNYPDDGEILFRLSGMLFENGCKNEALTFLTNAMDMEASLLPEFLKWFPDITKDQDILNCIEAYDN